MNNEQFLKKFTKALSPIVRAFRRPTSVGTAIFRWRNTDTTTVYKSTQNR